MKKLIVCSLVSLFSINIHAEDCWYAVRVGCDSSLSSSGDQSVEFIFRASLPNDDSGYCGYGFSDLQNRALAFVNSEGDLSDCKFGEAYPDNMNVVGPSSEDEALENYSRFRSTCTNAAYTDKCVHWNEVIDLSNF